MPDPTPSQTIGPFFGYALPFAGGPDSTPPDAPGAVRVEGQVLDGAGAAVIDAMVEVWAGDEFARCGTDSEGVYHVTVLKPPGRAPHAPHLEVTVFARGLLRQVVTRIYFPDEKDANGRDPALLSVDAERRSTLVATRRGEVLHFDIRLQGEGETVFFQL